MAQGHAGMCLIVCPQAAGGSHWGGNDLLEPQQMAVAPSDLVTRVTPSDLVTLVTPSDLVTLVTPSDLVTQTHFGDSKGSMYVYVSICVCVNERICECVCE